MRLLLIAAPLLLVACQTENTSGAPGTSPEGFTGIGEEDFERAIEMISKEVSRGPPKKTLGEFRPRQRSYSE